MSEQVRDSYVSIHAPVKVRHRHAGFRHDDKGFNSRTCEGATGQLQPIFCEPEVSIHAPVKVRLNKLKI